MKRVLFVCTGNTCRSPMAEAIARHWLRGRSGDGVGDEVMVSSAGMAAMQGSPVTMEALGALASRDIPPPPPGGSRMLDEREATSADWVFGMTRGHVAAVQSMAPGANAALLDPSGREVPDPFGGSAAEYDATCARLCELVDARLGELLPGVRAS